MPIYYRHFFEVNFAHRNGDGLIEKDQIKITVLSSDTMIGDVEKEQAIQKAKARLEEKGYKEVHINRPKLVGTKRADSL